MSTWPRTSHSRHRNRRPKRTMISYGGSPAVLSINAVNSSLFPQRVHSTCTRSPGPISETRASYDGPFALLRALDNRFSCSLNVLRHVKADGVPPMAEKKRSAKEVSNGRTEKLSTNEHGN